MSAAQLATTATPYTLQAPRYYRKAFRGSDRLFRACWRQYRQWLEGAIDNPREDRDVHEWLESIAAERVNNSRSPFYLRG